MVTIQWIRNSDCTMKYIIFFVTLLVVSDAKMMDMTHILNHHSRHGPMFRNFSLIQTMNATFEHSSNRFLANDVEMAEHTGTHIDAPVHSSKHGRYLHEIPYTQLVGPLVIIDVRTQGKTDPDYTLQVSDLNDYESRIGRIPDGAIVFLNTGGAEYYHDTEKYLGNKNAMNVTQYHYPGFGAQAATWLIKMRMIKGLGSDRLTFDIGYTNRFPVHGIIGINNVFGLENLANLNKVPVTGATVVVLPVPVEYGTGFPTRVMAFWGEDNELFASSSVRTNGAFILVFGSILVFYVLG